MTTFELLSSIRYDENLLTCPFNTSLAKQPSPFLLFQYHYDRLLDAATAFGWSNAMAILTQGGCEKLQDNCIKAIEESNDNKKPLRVRTRITEQGEIKSEAVPTRKLATCLFHASTFRPFLDRDLPTTPILTLYLNHASTTPSKFTSYKTTYRDHYNLARRRVGIEDMKVHVDSDVILYNEDDEIMESSIRNVAFWRDSRWVTPTLTSGCLNGIMRRWLLENRRIQEGVIRKADVEVGEWVLVFNAGEGCLLGKISFHEMH